MSAADVSPKVRCLRYTECLIQSDLCLHEEIVNAFNNNKILPDLPEMKLRTKDDLMISDSSMEVLNSIRKEYLKNNIESESDQ